MEWLFRRHFWIVELAFVALAAIILAFCVNKIIEHKLLADMAEGVRIPSAVPQLPSLRRDFEIANERNLFNAKREKAETIDLPEGNCDRFWESDKTSSSARLVGTLVFSNPLDSLIYVETSPNSPAKPYSLRECAPRIFSDEDDDFGFGQPTQACNNFDLGEIKRIEDECVYFYNRATRHCEHLALNPESVCNEKGDFRPKSEQPDIPTQPVTPQVPGETVKKTGANSFEIDGADLKNLSGNLGQLLAQAKVVPDVVDGKTALRFVNVQPGSFWEKIGFKIDDIITKINNEDIDAKRSGEFLSRLETDTHFSVEIRRDGSNTTFDYNVKR